MGQKRNTILQQQGMNQRKCACFQTATPFGIKCPVYSARDQDLNGPPIILHVTSLQLNLSFGLTTIIILQHQSINQLPT